MIPTGIRNNNWLNVKNDPSNPWKGSSGTDERGHAIFSDPVWGMRAAILNLRSYWRNNFRTVAQIINRWAPPDDTQGSIAGRPANDPSAYAAFVARRMNVEADQMLDLFYGDLKVKNRLNLRLLVFAMMEYEIEAGFVPSALLFDWALELI